MNNHVSVSYRGIWSLHWGDKLLIIPQSYMFTQRTSNRPNSGCTNDDFVFNKMWQCGETSTQTGLTQGIQMMIWCLTKCDNGGRHLHKQGKGKGPKYHSITMLKPSQQN